jgi:hypothetical protein
VVERRPKVIDYVTRDGRKAQWRRLVPDQDPVAISYGDATISWRINQNSIRMTVGIGTDETVQVGQMGFCSPDLLSRAGLRWMQSLPSP